MPEKVKQTLREEVGFGCPVKGCGNPYLEYHHFDPPVHIAPHNDPKGMIALCAQHHKKADGDAYTIEQLHELKQDKANAAHVRGNLDWLRHEMLAVVGGSFYYETPVILEMDGVEVISLKRDTDGYLRLSVNMLSLCAEDRLVIDRNSWENIGKPSDLRSPPQGKELEVRYPNGDYLHVRFIELLSQAHADKRYNSHPLREQSAFSYPITAVEVNLVIEGTGIEFNPRSTNIGFGTMTDCFHAHCGTAITVSNSGIPWAQNPVVKKAPIIETESGGNVIRVDFRTR
ncbi:HNH endonuclease [Ferrimonas sp. SCSIO 43195]|nr:HNH endonuclease [Ferrimonas sp. SCSIO 43195]